MDKESPQPSPGTGFPGTGRHNAPMPRTPLVLVGLALALLLGHAAAQSTERRYEGRAVDLEGRALAGVTVQLLDLETEQAGEVLASSGADGRFAVSVARPGRDGATAGRREVLWLARAGRASIAVPLEVPRDALRSADEQELGDVPMPLGMNLRGSVRSREGEPLADVRLCALDALADRAGLRGSAAKNLWFAVPTPLACARSDAEGRFELRGALFRGVALHAEKPGHAPVARIPVVPGERLILELTPTGFARGVMVDHEGAPSTNHVALVDEYGDRQAQRPDAEGRFEFSLRSQGRWLVGPAPLDQALPPADAPDWHSAAASELRIVEPAPAAPYLEVRVLDARNGEPVAGAMAGVAWHAFLLEMEMPVLQTMGFVPRRVPARDGVVTLPPPAAGTDPRGMLLVTAPGFAPAQTAIEGDDKGRKLEIRLSPGARVEGLALDPATGAPLAHARVWVTPSQAGDAFNMSQGVDAASDSPLETVCDAAGRFELGSLPKGRYELHAAAPGRPNAKPLSIALDEGESKAGLKLELPAGRTLRGTLRELPASGTGFWVELAPVADEQVLVMLSGFTALRASSTALRSRVGDDGRFTLTGLPEGEFQLVVRGPALWPGTAAREQKLDKLRLGDADLERSWTMPAPLRAELSGTLRFEGLEAIEGFAVPRQRLALRAEPATRNPGGGHFRLPSALAGNLPGTPMTLADRGGQYSLALDAGPIELVVFDVLTGVELHRQSELVIAAGERRTLDLTLRCGAARVTITAGAEGRALAGRAVSLALSDWSPQDAEFGHLPRHRLAVDDQQRELTLLLPSGRYGLAPAGAAELHASPFEPGPAREGDVEFAIEAGKLSVVPLELGAR